MTITGTFKPKQGITRIRILPDPKDVHLYWNWERGPKAMAEIATGISLCKLRSIPRARLTCTPEEVTCPHCQQRLRGV